MDRIDHQGIEEFKQRVLAIEVHGLAIGDWSRLLYRGSEGAIRQTLQEKFDITEDDTDEILR